MPSCLIIDDSAIIRDMASAFLAGQGFEVHQAETGREGLDVLQRQAIDVVLLDIVLPDTSGYDLLPQILSLHGCAVVVTTSEFSLESAIRVMRDGASDYLPKPFTEETLLMSFTRVLKRQELERKNQELLTLLQSRVDELLVLYQISSMITSGRSPESWINEVVHTICQYSQAQAGSLLLWDSTTDELYFYVATGPRGESVRQVRLTRGEGIAWWCFLNKQPVKVDDTRQDPRFHGSVDEHSGFVTRQVLAVPIVIQEKCVGVIELLNKQGTGCFTNEDLRRLAELSGHIAVAVQNALVIHDLKRSQDELVKFASSLEQRVEERTRELQGANQALQIALKDLERTNQLIQQAQSMLVAQEKMSAIGLLGAGVAHEINNPLGFVNSNLSTLEQYVRSLRRLASAVLRSRKLPGEIPSAQTQRFIQEVDRAIEEENPEEVLEDLEPLLEEMTQGLQRITKIVEDLRSFSEDGDDDGLPVEIDFNAELQRLVEMIRGSGKEPIQIQLELSPIPPVVANQKKLRQLMLNLMMGLNVLKNSPEKILLCNTSFQSGQVVLDFIDPGNACREEELGKLFDPFFLPGGGHQMGGLGLSTAHSLTRSLGGSVQVNKLQDGGLHLQLMLPIKPGLETGPKERVH